MTIHHSLEAKVPFIIAFFSKKIRHLVQMHSGKPTSKLMGSLLRLRAVAAEQRTSHPKHPPGMGCPCTHSICRWGHASRACCTPDVSRNLSQVNEFVIGQQSLMLLSLDVASMRNPLWSQAASQSESLGQRSIRSEAEGEVWRA